MTNGLLFVALVTACVLVVISARRELAALDGELDARDEAIEAHRVCDGVLRELLCFCEGAEFIPETNSRSVEVSEVFVESIRARFRGKP